MNKKRGFYVYKDVDWTRFEGGGETDPLTYLYHDSECPGDDIGIKAIDIKAGSNRAPLDFGDFPAIGAVNLKGIWDRGRGEITGSFLGGSFHQMMYETTEMLERFLALLDSGIVDEIYDPTIPHAWDQYLLMMCSEKSGIPYRCFANSILPWASRLKAVSTDGGICFKDDPAISDAYGAEKTMLLFESYLEKGWDAEWGASMRWPRRWLAGNVKDTIRSLGKKALQHRHFKEHERFVTEDLEEGAVVLYLHYQPEMNTMPAAGLLTSQVAMIERLRSLGKKVYLKEHPAQFSYDLTLRCPGRWSGFYSWVVDKYDVRFVPVDFTVQDLKNRGLSVATISGNGSIEALRLGMDSYLAQETYFLSDRAKKAMPEEMGLLSLTPDNLEKIIRIEAEESVCLMDSCRSAPYPVYSKVLRDILHEL